MQIQEFIARNQLSPDNIDGPGCLELLLRQMERGLAGEGKIPMIPSYLPLEISPVPGQPCCVMDAGGTNLRTAKAVFEADGTCTLTGLTKSPMPGTAGELSFEGFYGNLAHRVRETGCPERVGLCFSYNVMQERNLDGILHSWCKEVRAPEALGNPVGASLHQAVGERCHSVNVLNDSTAALLGAHGCDARITLGLILGTGINICYCEQCANIPKVPTDLKQPAMIISTEIGEFDGFPKNVFEEAIIAATDEPELARAEKQCAGGYLGDVICLAWQAAAREGLVAPSFAEPVTLPQISDYLAGNCRDLPEDAGARRIAGSMIRRAAKIAAVLTAGAVRKSCLPGQSCGLVIEGSQYEKLTGFGENFRRELDALLAPFQIRLSIHRVENSCLIGAALAAFAEPM